ncbi:MAG: DNA repair protein RecO [Candidatus Rokuibacteriota bacterium]
MALARTAAVVIGSFPLGESDRVVTFYSRELGKVRGVAKAARRMKSRFSGALELFTQGELVLFDTGRSDLVRIDHFDVGHPFQRVRGDLERLGQASWMVECVTRLTADRDRHPALYGLLVRSLRAMEDSSMPAWIAICFAARCLDALGHRPRLDRCTECAKPYPFPAARLDEGGIVCEGCAAHGGGTPISVAAAMALHRVRSVRWDEAISGGGQAHGELRAVLEAHMSRLIGFPTRTTKFLREIGRLTRVPAERP